jgi:hypothetical protein
MNDPKRLCQKDVHTASEDASAPSTVLIVDNHDKNLDASLIQDPEQLLELELIHAVPKDPVLDTIFRHLSTHVTDNRVATYLKLNFIKLAAVHAMKDFDEDEADLILALQKLRVDTTKSIIFARDAPAQKAMKACQALALEFQDVRKNCTYKLKQFVRDSGVEIPCGDTP